MNHEDSKMDGSAKLQPYDLETSAINYGQHTVRRGNTYTKGLKDERDSDRLVSTVNIPTTLRFTSSSQEKLRAQQGVA